MNRSSTKPGFGGRGYLVYIYLYLSISISIYLYLSICIYYMYIYGYTNAHDIFSYISDILLYWGKWMGSKPKTLNHIS